MNTKWVFSIVGFSLFLLIGSMLVWSQNTAIGYEETINNDKSALQVQAQRRFDVLSKLVNVVQANSQYEKTVQTAITQMRAALKAGDTNTAQMILNATAEAYPELKANAAYIQLMTEISTTENMIKEYRDTYNNDVQNYHQFTRRFPANFVLGLTGYKVIDYQYLTFTDNNLPNNLFDIQP